MFSEWRDMRLFSTDDTAASRMESQWSVKSSSLRMRGNPYNLNQFGIYERDSCKTPKRHVLKAHLLVRKWLNRHRYRIWQHTAYWPRC
jgi:hypothetical protein